MYDKIVKKTATYGYQNDFRICEDPCTYLSLALINLYSVSLGVIMWQE